MARKQSIGEFKVTVVSGTSAIANKAAPTVAELGTGVHATVYLTRDGLSTPMSGNTVDLSDAAELQNKQGRGTRGGDTWSLTAHRDDNAALDELYALLNPDFDGFLVIRRFGGTNTAYAAGDVVEVAPVECISRPMANIGENTSQRFTAELAVTGAVEEEAVVAA